MGRLEQNSNGPAGIPNMMFDDKYQIYDQTSSGSCGSQREYVTPKYKPTYMLQEIEKWRSPERRYLRDSNLLLFALLMYEHHSSPLVSNSQFSSI